MAAPSYSTDLTDIITDSASSTGWSLISSGGGGQNALTAPETDDYIQQDSGSSDGSVSRNPWSSSIRGMVYNNGTQTITSGDAVFIWTKADIAQALAAKASGGIQALVGSGTGALNAYYVEGNDTYQFGGWKCYPIDPTVTNSTSIGSPTATRSHFGVRWNVPASGPSKGFPFKIDAIRHGRTLSITDGDLANGYATFQGASDFQGNIIRQWGLFQEQNGTFLQQGLFEFGTTATAVDFRDSNQNIFIANTEFVSSTFNAFEVNNASSNVELIGVSISALGTVSKGQFTVNDNATVTIDGCAFSDMGTFTFLSNSTVSNSSLNRCEVVDIGGGTFDTVTFNNSVASATTTTSSLEDLTDCIFISDGSNHAVELTSIGDGTMDWNNFLSGYVAGPATGSTGNEAIYVNVGSGTLTINVGSGYPTPSIRTAGATVNVVAGQVTTTITVRDVTDNTVIEGARVYIESDSGGPITSGTVLINAVTDVNGQVSDTRSINSNQPITGRVRKSTTSPLYQTAPAVGTISSANGLDLTILMIPDE